MTASEPRDLKLLASILDEFADQVRKGRVPRYLYLPPGGTVSLADDVAWMLQAKDPASAWLAGMVIVERPELEGMGYNAMLEVKPLPAN